MTVLQDEAAENALANTQISREKPCTDGPGNVPVPGLSQADAATVSDAVALRVALAEATAACDWARVAELARALVARGA